MNHPQSNTASMLRACIYLKRLKGNVALVRKHVPEHVRIMGVVKCDAYGHGILQVSKAMMQAGIRELVVSNITEGLILRRGGITCPILVLSDPLYPSLQDALDHDLTITVSDTCFARRLIDYQALQGQIFQVHVKIDTGLGRFGLSPEQAPEICSDLFKARHINVAGIYSHLACTFKNSKVCNSFTRTQIRVFCSVIDELESAGMLPPAVHLGSSTGLLGFQEELCSGRFNALRIGTLFFGFTEREHNWVNTPMPVAEVTTRILQVREIEAGRRFGYHLEGCMSHAGRTAVIYGGLYHGLHGDSGMMPACMVHGRISPIMGRLGMAHSIIDISRSPEAKAGSKVILAGEQIDMCNLARGIGRGTWEVFLPLLSKADKTYYE